MKLLLVIGFSLFINILFSQIKLQLKSEETLAPIKNAKAFCHRANAIIAVSDDNGLLIIDTLKCKGITFECEDFEPFYIHDICIKDAHVIYLVPEGKSLNDVVVTAQMEAVKIDDAVQKVEVITKEVIQAKGAITLKDVLQNELNIRISQDQVLGSGMTMKGIGGEGIKFLVDGIPMIGRNDGNIDFSQIPVTNIERIEIIEGPTSVNYGSNAIGGTINIITKSKSKQGHTFNVASQYENIGQYNLQGGYQFRYKKHGISLTGGRNYFNGWTNGDDWDFFPKKELADVNRYKSWKPKEQYNASFKYYYAGKHLKITPFVDFYNEDILNRGIPRAPYYISAIDETYKTTRFNGGVNANWETPKYLVKLNAGRNWYHRTKNSYAKDLTTLNQLLINDASLHDTTNFLLYFTRFSFTGLPEIDWFRYEIGTEVNYEIGEGTRFQDGQKEITDFAMFGTTDFKLGKWVLNPGVRYNHNTNYGSVITPAINVKYNYKRNIFRASYTTGFRTPTLKEMYLDFVDINHNIVGNADLKPETSHYFQVWYNRTDSVSNWQFVSEFNPYYQIVNHKILMAQTANTTEYTYFNLDQYTYIGAQTSLRVKNEYLSVMLGLSGIATTTSLNGNKFAFTPEITSNISYHLQKLRLQFSAFYKYTGKAINYIQNEDGTLTQTSMNHYQMLDAQIQHTCWKNRLNIKVGVKNLLNVTNVLSSMNGGAHSGGSSNPIGTGRVFYCGLNFQIFTK